MCSRADCSLVEGTLAGKQARKGNAASNQQESQWLLAPAVYECQCGYTAATATAMHKHLTSAITTDAHQHRLKTTLLSKARPTAAAGAGAASTVLYGGSAAAGANMHYSYQQTTQMYSSQPDVAAGPLQQNMNRPVGSGTIRSSGNYPELPMSPHGSGAATAATAASRLNAALGTAMNSSPSKTRSGNRYSGEAPPCPNEYSYRQHNQQQACGGSYNDARPPPNMQDYPDAPAAASWPPAAGRHQPANSQAAMPNRAPVGSAPDSAGVGGAAAVQLAAGVSLTAQTTTIEDVTAAMNKKKSGSLFSKASKVPKAEQELPPKLPQAVPSPAQEPGHGTTRRKTSTTTFGMRLSGSMMAAFNGWLVNEAVTAATTAATTAAAAAFNPAGYEPLADKLPAAVGHHPAGHINSGDEGATAAAAGTPSKWSLSGLLARATSLERQHHLIPEASGAASGGRRHTATAALQATTSESSLDDDYSPSLNLNDRFMRSSDASTDDDSLGDGDDITIGEEAEATAAASASGTAAASMRRRRKPARSAAASLQPNARSGSSYVFVQRPEVAKKVKAVRRVLLWHNPAASWRVLGIGLYLVMLVGYIPQALHYMQLTTLLPGAAMLYLGYNIAKPWTIRGYCKLAGRSSGPPNARLASFEAAAADHVIAFSGKAAAELGIWTLAVLSLAHRALRGRRFTTSAWTVVTLWFLLLISELRVMDQTILAMFAFLGLFTIPWMYYKFKHTIDSVVYETINFLTLLVVHAERWAYAVALLAGGLVWQLLEREEGSVVVQGTAAALAAMLVLVWRVAVADV